MDNTFSSDIRSSDSTVVGARIIIAIYLDDICIVCATELEHLTHIRAVLQRLREHKLFVKHIKCEWMLRSTEILGHVVSADGMSSHPTKVDALQVWPLPTCVKELCATLGTFGFWRR